MKNKKNIIIIITVLVIVCLVIPVSFYQMGKRPVNNKGSDIQVTIPKNSTGANIINILKKNKLISNDLVAKLYLKLNKHTFKANTYILNPKMDLETIFKVLEGNDAKYIAANKITLKDGKTIPELAKAVSQATEIPLQEVLKKWGNHDYLKELMKDYDFLTPTILDSNIYYPLEGYLLPETFIIEDGEKDLDKITRSILDNSKKVLSKFKKQISEFKINNKNISIHEFLSLAAVVQAESPNNVEYRKTIAGILLNRLNKPMRLQCDVTVNYGNREVKVAVLEKDLKKDHKYNTYLYDGLPIGPICAISPEVMDATLNYLKTDYYFFFGTKDNKVLYSKTYQEHQEIVAKNKWY